MIMAGILSEPLSLSRSGTSSTRSGAFTCYNFHMQVPFVEPGATICRAGTLRNGESLKFRLLSRGREVEAFLIRHDGKYYAWLNRCAHMALTLDLDDNDFFTPDQRSLVCKTHAAFYKPDTGACFSGLCLGGSLEPVPLAMSGDLVILGAFSD
jgi:nitrite reductase/ring-hydroxylating ferredoxin subunit